ncbi:helix-turn-helix transcriptional regulator [Vibrio sonorensis]|uniref:helix-turn-helix transcriptional regulator n=1 Tax=Vibrio sonorensis TaxID=1004316 RepID=UPI0008D9E2F2|nr:AraC family transcriptional regulator [Vibrio sonorensis]
MDSVSYHKTPTDAINLITADYTKFAFQRHYHLDFHLGLITGGQQKFQYQGTQHHVGHGQIVVMPPDELHDGQSLLDSGYQVRVFSVDPRWFTDLADLKRSQETINFKELIVTDKAIFSALHSLHHDLQRDNISQLAKDCLPFEGFNHLFERFGTMQRAQRIPLGKQSIDTLKEFLLSNLDQPVRLEQLSNLCDLSPTQFQRHFKAKMTITPYAWLSRLRLEQSMKLLRAGIGGTEVAHQVGFYDQSHFSKAFKQCYGVSPSQINGANSF